MKKTLFFLAAALTFGFAANAQTIFSEDFDAVTVSSQTGLGELPDGWTLYEDNLNNYSTSQGGYTAFGKSWKVYDMEGDNMAISITYTMEGTACDRWLITPAITIPTEGDYKLLFDQVASQYSERMSVKVSTTNTEKASFTQTLIDNELLAAGLSKRLLDLSSFAGQTIYIAFIAQTADGLYMAVDDVQVKVVVPNAVSAVASAAPIWSVLNGDISTRLAVLNEGSAPLTSFDITYTVNGGAEQTISATGLNVAPFEYYVHTFNVATAGVGENVIEIVVSNPNGETNPDDCVDSTSCSTTVYDPATTATRTTLLEHFTTGACQYCPAGHDRLEQAIAGYEDKIAWVAHHVGYGTDNMTIDASDEVAGHFTANSYDSWVPGLYCTIYTEEQGGMWAPAMALDRTQLYASGANEDGVVGEVGEVSTLANQFANATIAPAFVSIAMSGLTYDPQTRQMSVTVSGEFLADYAGTQPRLSLYITQDSIYARQADATTHSYIQNYLHNHVIRASISNPWGDADAFNGTTAGSTYSKTFNYTLPADMRADHCRLVAFVNDFGPDMLHRTVANATKSGYLMESKDPTSGIADVEASIKVVTYPNPATEMAYITAESTIRAYEMIDALGRKVMSEQNVNADILELDVRGINAGVYFINVTTDNGVATQRLTVVK